MDYRELSPKQIDQLARTIHPGAWAIDADRPLSTLLGSCVAVCLFDPQSRIGGLNHFMLPTMRRSDNASLLGGEGAMRALLAAMLQRGACKDKLLAKAFGGGTIFETRGKTMDIGMRNARFAKEWLLHEEIPLLASDFLGPWSRKIVFLPYSGDAFCRRMATTMAPADLIAREKANYAAAQQCEPDEDAAAGERGDD